MSTNLPTYELSNKILGYLARLDNMLIIANAAGQNSFSQTCEGLVCEIFSCLENVEYKSVNLALANFAAVDLECTETKSAIQVTSSKGSAKVTDTLNIFLKKRLDLRYDRLMMVVLSNKEYNTKNIENHLVMLNENYGTSFIIDVTKDLIDLRRLYRMITNGSHEKMIQVHAVMQRFFDSVQRKADMSPYYARMGEMYYEPVMDEESGMTLSGIYLTPEFIIHALSGQAGMPGLRFFENHDMEILEETSIHQFLTARLLGKKIYDRFLVRPDARVHIILGYPGQGKTSMCKRLIHDLLSQPDHPEIFYVKLKDVVDTRSLIHNPFNVLCEELSSELGDSFSKDMLKNSITILDGLDELYMKDNLKAEDIEVLIKGIIRTSDRFENWQIIITTRYGYIDFGRLYHENYTGLLLKPLSEQKQYEWLQKYQLFHPESWMDEHFIAQVNNSKSHSKHFLAELINQPLLIYIIASLDHAVDVDANRTEIYNLLFDQIIERKYSREGQIENLKNLTRADLRLMLQEIAFMIFKSGKGYVSSSDILREESLEDIIAKIGDGHLSNSLKGVLISFYFREIRDSGSGTGSGIEFFHKSLQEYLTAERITNVVFTGVLNQDRQGKYLVKKGEQLLQFLNSVFAHQEITSEIWKFIKDLIGKKGDDEKLEVSQRLGMHIEYLFERDFVSEIAPGSIITFSTILRTFHAYWQFLKACDPVFDYIGGKPFSAKFFTFLYSINAMDRLANPGVLLGGQTIINTNIGSLSIVDEDFTNATIDRCSIDELLLMHCEVHNTNIMNSSIVKLSLDEVRGDLHFNQVSIGTLDFELYSSVSITFEHSNINFIGNASLKRKYLIEFSNCTFSTQAYEVLKNYTSRIRLRGCNILEERLHAKTFEIKTKVYQIADTLDGRQQKLNLGNH